MGTFDFAGFKRAFMEQDVPAWAAYYAEDAQWIEYRHANGRITRQVDVEAWD
jgi:ketosteroid isomerase-like protein